MRGPALIGRASQAILVGAMRAGLLLTLLPVVAWAQPLRATFTSETAIIPGNQAGDTALLRDAWGLWRDLVFGSDAVNSGFYGFFVDGGTAVSTGFGAVGGVDARPPLAALPGSTPGGLVVVSATNAGQVLLFTTHPDAGFPRAGTSLNVLTPGALSLGDFGDAGAFLFLATGSNNVSRWRLREDGGSVEATSEASIALPFAPQALATSNGLRRVYASIGIGGVVEIAPLETPPTIVSVIDAGASPTQISAGLAVYPQRDGGALLITSVPTLDLFRVYRAQPGQAVHLADFTVTAVDGGRKVIGAQFLDVWPGAFGVSDAGPRFDAGVLVVCDRLSTGGANYKLIPWDTLARAANPPLPIDLPDFVEPVITPPGPPVVPVVAVRALPPTSSPTDLSFWPDRDSLVVTLADGVSRLANQDLRPLEAITVDGGQVAGLDALGRAGAVPGGLVSLTTRSADGGALTLWTAAADGGLTLLTSVALANGRSVALADLGGDAGTRVFAASGRTVRQFLVAAGDAGAVAATALTDLQAPGAVTALAASSRKLLVATDDGVFELDPLAPATPARHLVDGGALGLATYAQRDGGALLLTIAPTGDLLSVFELAAAPLPERLSFKLSDGDGGTRRGATAIDVSVVPAGLVDGGATWPTGLLAVATSSLDGGEVLLVSWGAIAAAATPPLPIDATGAMGGGAAGGAGGGATGGGGTSIPIGGRNGGGAAGGGEEPPPQCCTGAPTAALIPAVAFLLWLRRFQRRRPDRLT